MGLKLQLSNPYGDKAEYINIRGYSFDRLSQTGHLVINVWKDEATRNIKGKSPVGAFQIAIGKETKQNDLTQVFPFDKLYSKNDTEIYTEVKKHKLQWNGEVMDLIKAEDVL
jgi:hypothetical protein